MAGSGSALAAAVRTAAAPTSSSPPTITGTVQQGQTLTADKGAWTGTEPVAYTYEWQRCDSGGGACAIIKSATATTYVLQKQDVNHALRVVATGKNAEGTISATSAATTVVTATANPATNTKPANTTLPTISGTVQEGQTLTATTGNWTGTTPITFTYGWQRCDSGGGHCANIGGANHATYTLQKQDVGKSLGVVVTAKNAAGTTSATSALTVAGTGAGVTAAVTLTLSTSAVVFHNPVTLSGTISSKQGGQSVSIKAQRFGFADAKLAPVATVTTDSAGSWSYSARPTVQTGYQAQWNGATSATRTVGVHPLVTFHAITGNRFSTTVVAGHSFATKLVQFQRRSSQGQWVTLKRMHLNSNSSVIFRAKLPNGTSSLRIAFSINQAGPGYLGGMSRTIVYHRG
jgi:hypothetical protein